MKRYKVILLMEVLLGLSASLAQASPFCVEKQGIPPECKYDDAVECRKNAQQVNGLCMANPIEVHLQPGVGKYCLVDSNRVSICNYADRDSCDKDAMRNGAVCVDFPTSNIQPDPYRNDPDSKY